MNTLSNFQFHKFNISSPRNFYNSYEFTNRKKSRTNSNGFYYNNTVDKKTLNNNRYNNIIPTFFSQQIPSKNNMNKLHKLSQDKFPSKKITNTDFETVLKFGDSNKIDELLPHMIYNDLSFAKNNHLRLVLSKYQNLLKYLFSQQQSLLNKNNKIETMFNNKNSNLNRKIKQLENDEYKMDSLYKSNKNTIEKLKEKIKNYKNILISSGKGNLIPKNFSKNFNKNGIYRCQICLGKTFNTNEDLQQHYIKEHYNIANKEININNNNNNNVKSDLTKSYFNKKLSIFKNELQDMILKKFQQNNNENNNISKIKLNSQYNNNNNIKMSNFNLLSNDEDNKNINDYLDRLEYEQKEQYAQLNNKISQMKNEVFNELKNLTIKPQIINENNQNKNQEQSNTNINLNNANSQINGNIIGNINNEKIQTPINNEDNNNKKIELNNPQIDINIPDNNNNINNFNTNNDFKDVNTNNNFHNDVNNNFNTNNNIENKTNTNNNVQNEQINLNPFKSKESKDHENNEFTDNNKNEVINSNKPNNDEEERNRQINTNNQENNENRNNNINPSTVKYIDQKNIIEEVSGRKESTMNNLTQNNIANPQNISLDKEEKFFTNTGDSVNENALTGLNQKLYNKNISHFSFKKENQEPMEKDEFINKIKERDENVLLDKDKNLSQIEINYDVINVKNENNLEQKKDNLIKEQEKKYLNDNLENLEMADYENIIKNIMKDTKEKIGKDKKYKEFFDNIITKKDLVELDLLFKDLQISTINANEKESKLNIYNTNKISALGDSKNISKNISMKKSNNYSRNLDFLERKKNSDFL